MLLAYMPDCGLWHSRIQTPRFSHLIGGTALLHFMSLCENSMYVTTKAIDLCVGVLRLEREILCFRAESFSELHDEDTW